MKTVESGYVSIPYYIRERNLSDDGSPALIRYEWVLESGMESDEWFESIEEARKDVQTCFE